MRRTLSHSMLLLVLSAAAACGDDDTPITDAGTDGATDAGSCPDEVEVTGEIDADTTWACPVYLLRGKVFVTDGATLTIEPGTTIYGDTGGSEEAALIVTRGSALEAVGTAAEPIVFTSGNPAGARATGDWAGVALLGSATVNTGSCVDDPNTGTPSCEVPGYFAEHLEGIDVADGRAVFGGTDDATSCGRLEYVRIEFAGAELSPDNELNGLTLGACGSGTTLSHLQVHRGKDDGIEFFGGAAGMDHVVISGPSDDGLDWDHGWRGEAQFVVIHLFDGAGDNAIEADNLGDDEAATPRSSPTLFNFTLVGAAGTRGMVLREGTRGTLRNFVVAGFGAEPADLRAAEVDLASEWPAHLSLEHSFFHDNGAYPAETGEDDDDGGFDEAAAIADAARANTTTVDPELGSTSATAPDYVPASTALGGQATPTFGDTTATYAGAFAAGATSAWTSGWTSFPEN